MPRRLFLKGERDVCLSAKAAAIGCAMTGIVLSVSAQDEEAVLKFEPVLKRGGESTGSMASRFTSWGARLDKALAVGIIQESLGGEWRQSEGRVDEDETFTQILDGFLHRKDVRRAQALIEKFLKNSFERSDLPELFTNERECADTEPISSMQSAFQAADDRQHLTTQWYTLLRNFIPEQDIHRNSQRITQYVTQRFGDLETTADLTTLVKECAACLKRDFRLPHVREKAFDKSAYTTLAVALVNNPYGSGSSESVAINTIVPRRRNGPLYPPLSAIRPVEDFLTHIRTFREDQLTYTLS